MVKKDVVHIGIRLPRALKEQLERAVSKEGAYLNVSDFVRGAIREKLRRLEAEGNE
jgi:Arc/MetJ-type ribon-helix-helix transcriptional regulator